MYQRQRVSRLSQVLLPVQWLPVHSASVLRLIKHINNCTKNIQSSGGKYKCYIPFILITMVVVAAVYTLAEAVSV